MEIPQREVAPVIWNTAGVKLLRFFVQNDGDYCFRMHWHERMELLRINKGAICVDFGTTVETVHAGGLVIIHPGQPHRGYCKYGPLEYDTIMFDLRSFFNASEICRQYLMPVFEGRTRFVPYTYCPEVLSCVAHIVNADTEGFHALNVTSEVYRLLFQLYQNCLMDSTAKEYFDKATRNMVSYMEKHYTENLTVDSLSKTFGYSKNYFCRKFRESTGLSPMHYLSIYRVERAYGMIKTGEKEIGKIALANGFNDANYFTRQFKKHFGHTPSYYSGLENP